MKISLLKQAKSEVLRARCNSQLKEKVVRIATVLMVDESDVVRFALNEYAQKFSEQSSLSVGR